jgi:hypothetical protein
MTTAFVKVKPLDGEDSDLVFHLATDRISSFFDGKLEAFPDTPLVQVRTVYGTNFHIEGTAQQFSEQLRAANFYYNYFPPA